MDSRYKHNLRLQSRKDTEQRILQVFEGRKVSGLWVTGLGEKSSSLQNGVSSMELCKEGWGQIKTASLKSRVQSVRVCILGMFMESLL